MFTGVKEICLKIEERHIEKIFKLIVKYNGCPEMLELLQAVVKVYVVVCVATIVLIFHRLKISIFH